MNVTRQACAMAIAALAAIGVAGAQEGEATEDAVAEVTAERDLELTPEQMKAEQAKFLPEMEQGATAVRRQLEDARAERDVVKVLCLNDKLNQLDVAIRSARDRQATFNAALESNDPDRLRHEFTVLKVLRDRARSLVTEANQCIGEETGFVGESKVTVTIDPAIPPDDTTDYPADVLVTQEPPTTVSSPL